MPDIIREPEMEVLVQPKTRFSKTYAEVTHCKINNAAPGTASKAVPTSLIPGIDLQAGVPISLVERALNKAAPIRGKTIRRKNSHRRQ